MVEGMIQLLEDAFGSALGLLQARVEPDVLADLAAIVYHAMTAPSRSYHNLEHVFSLVDEASPIRTLAALFHDLVYWQVDGGFPTEVEQLIAPHIVETDGRIFLSASTEPAAPLVELLLMVFDFAPGQLLEPSSGLNEFLSTLVMVKKLEGLLSPADLLRVALCIEGSIPFRPSVLSGRDYFYELEQRAQQVNQRFGFGLEDDQIIQAVRMAVRFANRDVASFAAGDVSLFLETTWKLVPEHNPSMRSIESWTVVQYRQALQAMSADLVDLEPERVFHQFGGQPLDQEICVLVQQAQRNLQTAQEYLRLKLLVQAILETLALETGGDLPLSELIGRNPARLEQRLPALPQPAWIDPASDLHRLLTRLPALDADFDQGAAPLCLYLWKCLPAAEIGALLEQAQLLFDRQIAPPVFLASIGRPLLLPILSVLAETAPSRSAQLLKLV